MGKSLKYFNSYFGFVFFILLALLNWELKAQGNCLLYPERSGERIACELSYRAIEYRQGSKDSQVLFDAAIKIGPKYAWAYYEKSVPYFKRGLFNEAVTILNNAIALEPENYLCYRAYWYFSQRSYLSCIKDLERYYFELNGPLRSTPGGDMEMRMQLGMAYAFTDSLDKAIEVVLEGINSYEDEGYFLGAFDYHVLGFLYFENGQFEEAIGAFKKQIAFNENFADAYYFLGLMAKEEANDVEAQKWFQESLIRFEGEAGGYSFNVFHDFNVFKTDVEKELLAFNF